MDEYAWEELVDTTEAFLELLEFRRDDDEVIHTKWLEMQEFAAYCRERFDKAFYHDEDEPEEEGA